MNNARRKELTKVAGLLEAARDLLEEIAMQERDAYDNLPESLQASERGEKMNETADTLEEVQSEVNELLDRINECKE